MYIDHTQFRLTKQPIIKIFHSVVSFFFAQLLVKFVFLFHHEGLTKMLRLAFTMRSVQEKFCQVSEHLGKRFIEQRDLC